MVQQVQVHVPSCSDSFLARSIFLTLVGARFSWPFAQLHAVLCGGNSSGTAPATSPPPPPPPPPRQGRVPGFSPFTGAPTLLNPSSIGGLVTGNATAPPPSECNVTVAGAAGDAGDGQVITVVVSHALASFRGQRTIDEVHDHLAAVVANATGAARGAAGAPPAPPPPAGVDGMQETGCRCVGDEVKRAAVPHMARGRAATRWLDILPDPT